MMNGTRAAFKVAVRYSKPHDDADMICSDITASSLIDKDYKHFGIMCINRTIGKL